MDAKFWYISDFMYGNNIIMKLPHLTITKKYENKPLFESAAAVMQQESVCSIEHNCFNSCSWKSSFTADLQTGIKKMNVQKEDLSGIYYIVQNCTCVEADSAELALSVCYPLKLWIILQDSEGIQTYTYKDMTEDVSYLHLLIPHIHRTLGYEAVQYFKQHILTVAEAEEALQTFFSLEKAPGAVKWRKKNRPTFLSFHSYINNKEISTLPITAFKFHFLKECEDSHCMNIE